MQRGGNERVFAFGHKISSWSREELLSLFVDDVHFVLYSLFWKMTQGWSVISHRSNSFLNQYLTFTNIISSVILLRNDFIELSSPTLPDTRIPLTMTQMC